MCHTILRVGVATFLLLLGGCVAQSGSETRFQESAALSFGATSITPTNPNVFSFAIVGDVHMGTDATRFAQILSQSRVGGNDFVILLGDIVDKGTKESFEVVRTAIQNSGYSGRVLPVIGNHDVFENGWQHYKDSFGPSHYAVSIGNSKFIALDTADGTVGDAQRNWLSDELAKPKAAHTFLLSHYLPVIPTQRTYLRLADEREAMRLMKLAQNNSVRAWLGAHYHSFISETIDGVQYVVAGGGGGRRMEPIKEFFYVEVLVNGTDVRYTMKRVD